MYAFVYGTLKNKMSNNGILAVSSTLVTTAVVRGFKLYNSGFPVAAVNADTLITGEVWDIGNPEETKEAKWTLSALDRLEGYRETQPDGSMYHRIAVTAHGDDGVDYAASMYLGNPKYWDGYQGMRACDYDASTNAYTWGRGRL